MLMISNRTLPAHSSDFKITCMISDQIHSTYPFSLIAGFHCHASKNKNKTINSRIWEMKWGWYRKTLAKIQVSMIFHTRNILRNCLLKIIERFLWRRHVGAHPNGHQHVPNRTIFAWPWKENAQTKQKNKRTEIERFVLSIERIQTRVAFAVLLLPCNDHA